MYLKASELAAALAKDCPDAAVRCVFFVLGFVCFVVVVLFNLEMKILMIGK